MRVAISRCLLGQPVRYDGRSKPVPEVMSLAGKVDVCPVCPEGAAGLPVPRLPRSSERDASFCPTGGT